MTASDRVLISSSGIVYHTDRNCPAVLRMADPSEISQRDATLYFGRTACNRCKVATLAPIEPEPVESAEDDGAPSASQRSSRDNPMAKHGTTDRGGPTVSAHLVWTTDNLIAWHVAPEDNLTAYLCGGVGTAPGLYPGWPKVQPELGNGYPCWGCRDACNRQPIVNLPDDLKRKLTPTPKPAPRRRRN